MATIFRLGTDGATTHQGWTQVATYPYHSENRKSITDPNGASARNEVTSIPTPLARIDVVKNAFAQVVAAGAQVAPNSIFHKTVSHTLDVGEVFFNIEKYRRFIEIIKWDKETDLNLLKKSEIEEHRLLADAIEKYMQTDATSYNFDLLQGIYLLNDKGGKEELNIIGATSPATLFMSTANDVSEIGERISFGTHTPFGTSYRALAERDIEYVKFWFLLRKTIPHFATRFEGINDYLALTYSSIKDLEKKRAIDAIESPANYQPIDINASSLVEVCGNLLYKRPLSAQTFTSDFEILPSREVSETLPLVLPVDDEGGNKYASLRYTTDIWGARNSAPYSDSLPLSQRILPNDGTLHPYLTISDFLEPTLLRVNYQWNAQAFFTGKVLPNLGAGQSPRAYLLPLTAQFFAFFTPDDIDSLLTVEELAAGVKVTLRIPIKGNGVIRYIEYCRRYYNGRNNGVNEGRVVNVDADGTTCNFQGFVMPCVRFKEEVDALFTVGCIAFTNFMPTLRFGQAGKWVEKIEIANRDKGKADDVAATTYTIKETNFEYICVELRSGERSIIVPKLRPQQANNTYHVAVDVGTSNTHVEISQNGQNISHPLVYNENNSPATHFFKPTTVQIKGRTVSLDSDLDRFDARCSFDYLPLRMENKGEYAFPTPTALTTAKNINWKAQYSPFSQTNVALDYFRHAPSHEEIIGDIKWGGNVNDEAIFRAYVENILLLLRNWLLINNADLKATRLTWFYPLSMTPRRLHGMERAWNDAWHLLFNKQTNTTALTESESPTLYYYNTHASARDIVSIDIGGGTTDIAISETQQLKFVTSFRFAANDIFQNGLANIHRSGIIDFYHSLLRETFKDNESIYSQYLRSDDMPATAATRLFALKDSRLAEAFTDEAKDFSRLLSADDDFKIVFILFYTAIIYHLGLLLKLTGRAMPRHITFSGNGSKVLNILTSSTTDLALFTKRIFSLLGVKDAEEGRLEILGLEEGSEPKRATCMGALINEETQPIATHDMAVAMHSDGTAFLSNNDTFDQIENNPQCIETIRKSVEQFFQLALYDLDKVFSFKDYFGATYESIELARQVCRADEDTLTYIRRGIVLCRDNADGNSLLSETLFFYPLKGILANLAEHIHKEFKNKHI